MSYLRCSWVQSAVSDPIFGLSRASAVELPFVASGLTSPSIGHVLPSPCAVAAVASLSAIIRSSIATVSLDFARILAIGVVVVR
ncbi:unnamed protein product [Citrullus colocynthis]|uniref:Uncharacterized protein n=1 Tax=Citrullus colocynthis TaxID=252529 RepID=A0ABP0Y4P3_9ROSI